MQLKGFYEGLWYGANPDWRKTHRAFNPFAIPAAPDPETVAMGAIVTMLNTLRSILKEET